VDVDVDVDCCGVDVDGIVLLLLLLLIVVFELVLVLLLFPSVGADGGATLPLGIIIMVRLSGGMPRGSIAEGTEQYAG
jgi:hypothetical protein